MKSRVICHRVRGAFSHPRKRKKTIGNVAMHSLRELVLQMQADIEKHELVYKYVMDCNGI